MAVFDNIKGISVASGFKLQAQSPLDPRLVVDTISDRNLLVTENGAYEGMKVYVKADKKTYELQGTTNSDWVEVGGKSADVANLQSEISDARGSEASLKDRFDSVDTELAKKANIADTYTKGEVDAKVSSVYKYKGTVANISALPTEKLTVGDVYNVEAAGTIGSGKSAVKVNAGDNVAWTGTAWDVLAGTVDLSDYYNKEQVDNKINLNHVNVESNYEKTGTGSITQQFDSGDTIDFTGKNNYFTQSDLTSKFGADSQMTSIPKGAVGNFASSLGGKSTAKGKRSMAQGTTTIAAGAYSHAEGDNSVALGDDSHAEGYMNLSRGTASHAEGQNTHAIGGGSHTEGSLTVAEGTHAHAEGVSTTATGDYSHTEGLETKSVGTSSHAEGSGTEANGANSHAEGYKNASNGQNSHAEGDNTITTEDANGSHAEGHYTEVRTVYSHAEGSKTIAGSATAIEEPSTGEGGSSSIETPGEGGGSGGSEGGGTSSIYEPMQTGSSHSEGYRTASYGTASHAEGSGTLAYNYNSHAEGQLTKAYGNSSHAEGIKTVAGVEGNPSVAWASHAEGSETNATGYYSHAEGRGTTASGSGAHAEGDNTTASGKFSHTEGKNTTASGELSKAFGFETKANGVRSVAGGYQAEANGDTSLSFGEGTVTTNENEVAFGKFNKSNTDTLFSIGIGMGPVGSEYTKNAFEVTKDGKVTIPKLQDHYTISQVDEAINNVTTLANEAKTTADSKVNVVWVAKGESIPTTAAANSLCFRIL